MSPRTKALAGATLALALALTGCTVGDDAEPTASASTTTAAPETSASPTPPASPASSSTSESPSETASPSSSAPEFTAVTSERPRDDQDAQIHGFEAVQLLYDIQREQFTQNTVDQEQLGLAVREPYLSKLAEQMQPIEDANQEYGGKSKVELVNAIIAPTRTIEGEGTPHANAQLLVCEDNTGVVVKDEDGKRVSSGSVLRYQITYIATWQEDDQAWKVVTREVMRDEDGDPKPC